MPTINIFDETSSQLKLSTDHTHMVFTTISQDHSKVIGWINVILMLEPEHTELNNKHLNHDFATDVITFDFTDEEGISGEIYINMDMAHTNAEAYSVQPINEVQRLMIHGMLHLVGYDDHTDDEREKMHQLENKYLKGFM